MRRCRIGLLSFGVLLGAIWSSATHADPPKKGRPKVEAKQRKKRSKRRPKAAPHARKREREREAPHREAEPEPTKDAHAVQKAAQEAAEGVNSEIVKEGGANVKMMSFSGLDIEGRLKSPQLMYFVSRVHAEFERPKLPHRSFMPELMRTGEQEPLR